MSMPIAVPKSAKRYLSILLKIFLIVPLQRLCALHHDEAKLADVCKNLSDKNFSKVWSGPFVHLKFLPQNFNCLWKGIFLK